jgi:predicted AAA+ superfamily ATPase
MLKSRKSILLLGPRQVGKSTLIKSLKPELTINLADERTYLDHVSTPELIQDLIERKKAKTIFVDEVQRIPSILNTIQAIVDENPKLKFYLTGSSARKLKKQGVNLLPGRVFNYQLGPLTLREVGYKTKIEDLAYGFLPEVWCSEDSKFKEDLLSAYSANYIREEIKAESLVRNLDSFSRFLNSSASQVGNFIDYSKMSKDIKISRHACPRYFEIFEDTLIGNRIYPDQEFIEKYDLIKHPKFYFFDVGVYNGLIRNFNVSLDRQGALFEQVVYSQLLHSANALRKNIEINSFRTRGGLEIDFMVRLDQELFAIEVKSAKEVSDSDVASLLRLKKDEKIKPILFFQGKNARKINGVWCLPWAEGIKELGL